MTAPVKTVKVRRVDLVDRHEAAEILGVHPNSIDQLAEDKVIRKYHIRGLRKILFLRAEVEDCIEPVPEES
jgi:excisionase family DNA binding protein